MVFVDSICDRTEIQRADGFFFQEKEGWLSKENIPVNRKKKGEADKEKDRGLPPWPSEQPRPKNTILGLRLPLAKEKLRVHQLSKNSQMPSAPQEEKHFYQEHTTCHLSHGLFLHPSLLTSQMFSNGVTTISLKAKEHWLFPILLNRWGICNRILVMFINCFQFVDSGSEVLTVVQFLFSFWWPSTWGYSALVSS